MTLRARSKNPSARYVWAVRLVCWTVGCCAVGACSSVKSLAIDTLVASMEDGSDSLRAHFDWETAGHGAASGIMQLEALYGLRPNNESLALALVKSYMAYAYGWVMEKSEAADARADFDAAAHHQRRAYLMYTRAKNVAMRTLELRDEEVKQVLGQHPRNFLPYLRETYTDQDEDVAPIFWLMMAWSSAVNNSDDGSEFADIPYIKALAQRVLELDASFGDAGALVFMGGMHGSYSEAFGGDHKLAKQYFEQALKLTERRNHIVHVNYAKMYAVAAQDRALFERLLREVLEAPDQGDRYRLGNKVALRRARRYLRQVDDFFFE